MSRRGAGAAASAAPSPVTAVRAMRNRAASSAAAAVSTPTASTAAGASAGDALPLSPFPSAPPSLLKRGRKRKDASLERPAADVSAALEQHYEKQQQQARGKLAKQPDSISNGQHMPERSGQESSLITLKDGEATGDAGAMQPDASAPATNGSMHAHAPAPAAARARQVKQKVSKKKKRPGLTAAAAAAVGVTSIETLPGEAAASMMSDEASSASRAASRAASIAAASSAAAASSSSTAASIVPLVPCPTAVPSSLTRAIPFIFHMLSTQDLLVVEGVCSIWKHVASQPLVFNSATSWRCVPGDLQHVAAHPVLRHVKRLTLGRGDAASASAAAFGLPGAVGDDLETTRDAHLKGILTCFSQIQVLTISALELANLYALTEEFGELGQRGLRELHILRDSSLGATMRKRAAAQADLDAEAQQQQLAAIAAAATAAAAAAAASSVSDDVVAMEDVGTAAQPILQKAPSTMSMSDSMPLVAPVAASAASAPNSSMLVLSPSFSTSTLSSAPGSAVAGTRRLPSLYNIVSLLSLLPNLCVFEWQPLLCSDFERPNVALKSLHTLKIRHPYWHRDGQDETIPQAPQGLQTQQGGMTNGVRSSSDSFDLPPPPPPTEKTVDQIHFLRKLPSLTCLDWPGWSAENLRQFCAPLSSSYSGGGGGTGGTTPNPSSLAQGGTLQDAINSALASGVYGPSGQPFIPSLTGGLVAGAGTVESSLIAHYSLGRSNQPQLAKLLLPFDVVADAHLASIANLKSLTHLSLCLCAESLTDAGLQSLCSLELLQHLELKGVMHAPQPTKQMQTPLPIPTPPMSVTAPVTPATASAAAPPASADFLALPTASPGGHCGHPISTRPPILAADASASARPMSLELGSLAPADEGPAVGSSSAALPPPIQLPEDAVAAADIAADADADPDPDDAAFKAGRLLSRQESIVSYDQDARSIVAAWSAATAIRVAQEHAQAAWDSAAVQTAPGSGNLCAGSSCTHPLQLSRSTSAPASNGPTAAAALSSSSSSSSRRSPPSFNELAVVRLSSLCSLRRLVLDQIDLGKDGLHTIFHSLSHLRVLELRRMSLPTLAPIACLPLLKSLSLKRCRLTNDDDMRWTLRQLKLLRVVEIKQCAGVSEQALTEMQSQLAAPSFETPHWPDLSSVQFEAESGE